MEHACATVSVLRVAADVQSSTQVDAGRLGEVGAYLTDGVFLYRVASAFGATVELEDCYGLDVVQVPAERLSTTRLRIVVPAPS